MSEFVTIGRAATMTGRSEQWLRGKVYAGQVATGENFRTNAGRVATTVSLNDVWKASAASKRSPKATAALKRWEKTNGKADPVESRFQYKRSDPTSLRSSLAALLCAMKRDQITSVLICDDGTVEVSRGVLRMQL